MTLVPLGVLGASCALGSFEKVEAPVDAGIDLGCQHATVPIPPTLESLDAGWPDATVATGSEFVAAIHFLRTRYAKDGGPLGLDLDRFCSCQGEPSSCIARIDQDKELSCDLASGRDNQLTTFFRVIEFVLGFDSEEDSLGKLYSEFANLGQWTILFKVTGYNGLPNDEKVRVEWYPSSGLLIPDGGGSGPPKWNGMDEWAVAPSAVDASDDAGTINPVFFDNDGYVTNGVLVFSLPSGDLLVTNGLNRLAIRISDGTVMGHINPYGSAYALEDGIIAGRVSEENMFRMFADFRDHNGIPICAVGNASWGATRDGICRSADIQVGSPAPNKRCDAISLALGFEAEPAKIGGIGQTMTGQMDCPDGGDALSVYLEAGCPLPDSGPSN